MVDVETLSNGILDGEFDEIIHTTDDNSLTHHGVKGMKWGVRKDRKKRPSIRKIRKTPSDDRREVDELIKRGPKNLSNIELQKVISRINSENQYKRLVNKKNKKNGESFVKKLIKAPVVAAGGVLIGISAGIGKKYTIEFIEAIKEGWMNG